MAGGADGAAALMQQRDALSQAGGGAEPVDTGDSGARHPPGEKADAEAEDEERYGCSWGEIEDKLRFDRNWEVRRETLYFVRDNARKKDPRVLATLKHMAKHEANLNVQLAAAEILIHVGMQTLPEQIWMLGHEDWFTRKNAIGTLEFAAEPEDDAVMTALSLSMTDASSTVRNAAVESLMHLARKRKNSEHRFPPFVLHQLLERLGDADSRVRKSAADGIAEVAAPGDRDLMQDLAKKMTSRVTAIRRGASEVLKKLAIKFNEAADRSARPADPEASPLAQIQKLLLHPDVQVQRAAIEAMQGISASTTSLYTATDEVVQKNKASALRDCPGMDEESSEPRTEHTTAAGSTSASSRPPTTIGPASEISSRLHTGTTAGFGGEEAAATPGDASRSNMLDVGASDSDEGDSKEAGVEQGEDTPTKATSVAPRIRSMVLPVAFRKSMASGASAF